VKRALASLAGIVGIAALGRMLSRRRHHPAGSAPATEPTTEPVTTPGVSVDQVDSADDPAEELRRKLAAAKQADAEPAEPVVESLDERRARVHAKARKAMDAMNDEGPAA